LIGVYPKADLGGEPAAGSIPVSSVTGGGIPAPLERIEAEARTVLPGEASISLNRRQARHLSEAAEALGCASRANELVLVADHLWWSRTAFARLTAGAGVEDVLDALFSRFCLGK